jgi:hypothetical protein
MLPRTARSNKTVGLHYIRFQKTALATSITCMLAAAQNRRNRGRRDELGLAVLAGHWRYAHISALRGDGVNPELLGMTKVASEDSVRRGLSAMKEEESEPWLKKHLQVTYKPLLEEPWALDVDTTVKPLYGHQEDAKVGYNPQKPGREFDRPAWPTSIV